MGVLWATLPSVLVEELVLLTRLMLRSLDTGLSLFSLGGWVSVPVTTDPEVFGAITFDPIEDGSVFSWSLVMEGGSYVVSFNRFGSDPTLFLRAMGMGGAMGVVTATVCFWISPWDIFMSVGT